MASFSLPSIVLLGFFIPLCISMSHWTNPGCHLAGYDMVVQKDNCQRAIVHINACRGCCASLSYPSSYETVMQSNGRRNFTSRGSCCSISKMIAVNFDLICNGQPTTETIQSAGQCSCGVCKED